MFGWFGCFDGWTLGHRLTRGFDLDDVSVSFTVLWVSVSSGTGAHETEIECVWGNSDASMCIGSTSRRCFGIFQLESLILAQNERWRQA